MLLGRVGTELQGGVFTGSLGGTHIPRAPRCWVLQRRCPEAAPNQFCGECGEGGPDWREKRGIYLEKGGCGLSGLGDGGAWLKAPLHLDSASVHPRGAGSPALRPSFRPQEAIGSCHVGKLSQLIPSSYHTQALEQGPRYSRMGHPDTVHINSRPFCTCARACLSLSFWGDISNYESHTTVKTQGRL